MSERVGSHVFLDPRFEFFKTLLLMQAMSMVVMVGLIVRLHFLVTAS